MSLKYSILGLLHYRDLHGYRIKEIIEQNFGHMWTINYGQIYPNLKSMLQDELIDVEEENRLGEKGPPRKLYSISQKGRKVFQDWLMSAPEREMLLRDPFLMRFVFFGFGEQDKAIDLIDEQLLKYKAQLQVRKDNLNRWQRNDIYVNLMAELGVKMNQVMLDWLKDAREQILNSETTLVETET